MSQVGLNGTASEEVSAHRVEGTTASAGVIDIESLMEDLNSEMPISEISPELQPADAEKPEETATCEVGESSARLKRPQAMGLPDNSGTMFTKLMSGLKVIEADFLPMIVSKRMKLKERRHVAFEGVSNSRVRLLEEMDRQRFIERRLSEKSEVHAEIAEDYEQAR